MKGIWTNYQAGRRADSLVWADGKAGSREADSQAGWQKYMECVKGK